MNNKKPTNVASKDSTKDTYKIKNWLSRSNKQNMFVLGVCAGLLLFFGYRFANYNPEHTHYHSNFALYVNGEIEQFDGYNYYEELTGCSIDAAPSPGGRGHMHEPENGLVHIHDEAVTWGSFFENLGYSVGNDHVATGLETYVASDNQPIEFILNGKSVIGNIADKEIGSEDRLLVVVGTTKVEALALFEDGVPNNANEFNESDDPGTCSSGEGHGFMDRLKETF